MRVAVISKSDATGGGAGRVAADLTNALNNAGHPSMHFAASAGAGFTETLRPLYGGRTMRKLTERAQRKLERLGLQQAIPLELPALLAAGITRRFDLVHFHDLSSAISPLTVGWFSLRMPAAWTFHDCSPFTGGCLYPMDCDRYLTRCGTKGGCPQLGQWPVEGLYDFTGALQTVKTGVHRLNRITTTAPSAWMADLAYASGKVRVRPHVISNGIDVSVFQPAQDKVRLRRELGLPQNQPVILVSAAYVGDQRKGVAHALEALNAVPDLQPFALVVGNPNPALNAALEAIPHRVTGFIADTAVLARWYSAADLLLNCSLAESQCLVVIEAMACAVPTVGFATGGIPASVVQGETGFLVPPLDRAGLIAGLRQALEPGTAAAWGLGARRRAEANFSAAAFLRNHLALYDKMLQSWRG